MVQSRVLPKNRAESNTFEAKTSTVKERAAQQGISRATYYRRLNAASQPGRKSRLGRPRLTTLPQRKALKAKANRSGGGTRKLAEWSVQQGYPKVSRQTVASILKGGRRPLAYKPVKSGRVLSEKNRQRRLQFVEENQHTNFDCVVFIDQELSIGYDESKGLKKTWQPLGRNKIMKKSTNPQKFMFYAAVAKGHKSELVRVPLGGKGKGSGTVGFDSAMFLRVFRQLWRQVKRWYPQGQQFWVIIDSARQHTSKHSKSQLAAMGVPLFQGFPPQSYDMNLIEVVWGHLQQGLLGQSFKDKSKYEKKIREAWGRVQQSTIDKLVANHKQQLQKIKKANGNWVDY